jgi:glycosyltransferase involved in cell wall biosynthesis
VTVCIPHWQVQALVTLCLRSIRRHSRQSDLEVIVVDNGSRDASLDYLRSLPWIRLIERPEESVHNWPANVFTAWDVGRRAARGEFFVTMHTDVIVRRDDWLELMLAELQSNRSVAAAGAWKLALEPAWYVWQKEWVGRTVAAVKGVFGRRVRGGVSVGKYPRDYCAMYRRSVLDEHALTFVPEDPLVTGGYSIAKQLWSLGYETRMIPLAEMARRIVHVAHGTAALAAAKPLNHASAQAKVERRVAALFNEPWIHELRARTELDAA